MENLIITEGSLIKSKRGLFGMSQEELGNQFGASQRTISYIENNKRKLPELRKKIMDFFVKNEEKAIKVKSTPKEIRM